MSSFKPDNGYFGAVPSEKTYDVMLIEGKYYRIKNVTVHQFTMGDVDDPQLYAAEPLLNWQNSESGKWIMEHAVETPMWHQIRDYNIWGTRFAVTAKLKEVDYTFWTLKWGMK